MTILDDGFEPRKGASKLAAAQHRERETEPQTTVAVRRPTPSPVLAAAIALLIVAGLIVASYQLSGGRPKALAVTPQPTVEAPTELAHTFSAPPTAAPAPRTAPIATIAPTRPPVPVAAPVAVPVAPMTGRGLGVIEPAPVVEAAPPTYIEVVSLQAPHCVRDCDGQPGPAGGDYVIVPTLAPEQLRVVAEQAEHKVR